MKKLRFKVWLEHLGMPSLEGELYAKYEHCLWSSRLWCKYKEEGAGVWYAGDDVNRPFLSKDLANVQQDILIHDYSLKIHVWEKCVRKGQSQRVTWLRQDISINSLCISFSIQGEISKNSLYISFNVFTIITRLGGPQKMTFAHSLLSPAYKCPFFFNTPVIWPWSRCWSQTQINYVFVTSVTNFPNSLHLSRFLSQTGKYDLLSSDTIKREQF